MKKRRGAEGKEKIVVAVEVNKDKVNKKGLIHGMGRVRISVISDCQKVTLRKFILENIEKGSTLYTDDWKGYNGIDDEGYTRIIQKETTDNDIVIGVNKDEVTPNVHIVASLLTRISKTFFKSQKSSEKNIFGAFLL